MNIGRWTAGAAARGALCALAGMMIVTAAWAGAAEDAERAETEFARGNLVGALKLWRMAADEGHAKAQARLGDILDKAEDDAEAVAWYRKSAEQGDADGEYGLGQMYAKGEGVERDLEKARSHIERAADKGHAHAIVQMRESFRLGALGFPVDLAQSAAWDEKFKALPAAPAAK